MKRNLKLALLILLCVLLIPFELFFRTITGIMIVGTIDREIECYTMRKDIFEYVLENKDSIELESSDKYQEFFYAATGLQDGGTTFGYYYAPDNDYYLHGEPYRNGLRFNGFPDDDTDWYYTEQICENWFYYEIHDG